MKKNNFLYTCHKNKTLLLMLLPSVLFFLVLSYLPMTGVILAFKRFTFTGGIFGSPWVGNENFRFMFISGDAYRVVRNTVLYNLTFITINNSLQIVCSIVLAELMGRTFKKVSQSLMFLPNMISWVVVGALAYNIFNYEFGSLNTILKAFSIKPIDIYGTIKAWPMIIVAFNAWKNIGVGTILYLATITGIDPAIYEAADIDGAKLMQRIRLITLPFVVPTAVVLILLSIGNIFRGDFQMYYQLVGSNALLYEVTDVIDTYVNRSLVETREIGMAASAGFLQSVLGFSTIILVNTLVRKYQSDYALF